MGYAEASRIVDAERRDLFHYSDWCYNVPEWISAIRKTWIVRLPNSAGLGKITYYIGTIMGREMEWQAQSGVWRENEFWMMKASTVMPAKMNMHLKLRFETVGEGMTKAMCVMGFRTPYPLIGPFIDRFYLRKEAQRLVNIAVEGLKQVADQHMVPPVELQFERRKADHPGYTQAFVPFSLH
ncbi:MAG TPA: hypothetical protein VFF30_14465 [Nitrososphaerales archaeon]|nr:hypothetical protein [Nitrososphaerales archaeon]